MEKMYSKLSGEVNYASPSLNVIELATEGVLCSSGGTGVEDMEWDDILNN